MKKLIGSIAIIMAVTIASAPAAFAADGKVTLIAVGDNLIHKALYEHQYDAPTGQYDFNSCYDNVRGDIQSHDLAVINQETIFVS